MRPGNLRWISSAAWANGLLVGTSFTRNGSSEGLAIWSRHAKHFPIGHVKILASDPIGGDIEVPPPLLALLDPERGADRDGLIQPTDELCPRVGLFGHQYCLIHGSTPLAASVTA